MYIEQQRSVVLAAWDPEQLDLAEDTILPFSGSWGLALTSSLSFPSPVPFSLHSVFTKEVPSTAITFPIPVSNHCHCDAAL